MKKCAGYAIGAVIAASIGVYLLTRPEAPAPATRTPDLTPNVPVSREV